MKATRLPALQKSGSFKCYTKRRKMTMKAKAIWAAGAALTVMSGGALAGGCGGGTNNGVTTTPTPSPSPAASPTPNPTPIPAVDAPAELFGTWQLVSITGGITGQGRTSPAPMPLTFNQDGTVTPFGGGRTTFRVVRRTTFLRAGTVAIVEYGNGSLSQILDQVDAQNLVLADEANDGFTYSYVRGN